MGHGIDHNRVQLYHSGDAAREQLLVLWPHADELVYIPAQEQAGRHGGNCAALQLCGGAYRALGTTFCSHPGRERSCWWLCTRSSLMNSLHTSHDKHVSMRSHCSPAAHRGQHSLKVPPVAVADMASEDAVHVAAEVPR